MNGFEPWIRLRRNASTGLRGYLTTTWMWELMKRLPDERYYTQEFLPKATRTLDRSKKTVRLITGNWEQLSSLQNYQQQLGTILNLPFAVLSAIFWQKIYLINWKLKSGQESWRLKCPENGLWSCTQAIYHQCAEFPKRSRKNPRGFWIISWQESRSNDEHTCAWVTKFVVLWLNQHVRLKSFFIAPRELKGFHQR